MSANPKTIYLEGYTADEILSLPDEMLNSITFSGEPMLFQIGSAQILGAFRIQADRLQIELAQIEGGGEGVLPLLWLLAERYARQREIDAVEWVVHAVNCADPNPKLRRVLEKRGFIIQDIPGHGTSYYRLRYLPKATDLVAFRRRRKWFDAYYERFNLDIKYAPEYGVRFTCPCCGYPTLPQRRGDYICALCNWQDDGQDDPNADEVWGGPNKSSSLTTARENFPHYRVMWEPNNDPRMHGPDSEAEREAKLTLMQAFDALVAIGKSVIDEEEEAALWRTAEEKTKALRAEQKRQFEIARRNT